MQNTKHFKNKTEYLKSEVALDIKTKKKKSDTLEIKTKIRTERMRG